MKVLVTGVGGQLGHDVKAVISTGTILRRKFSGRPYCRGTPNILLIR